YAPRLLAEAEKRVIRVAAKSPREAPLQPIAGPYVHDELPIARTGSRGERGERRAVVGLEGDRRIAAGPLGRSRHAPGSLRGIDDPEGPVEHLVRGAHLAHGERGERRRVVVRGLRLPDVVRSVEAIEHGPSVRAGNDEARGVGPEGQVKDTDRRIDG